VKQVFSDNLPPEEKDYFGAKRQAANHYSGFFKTQSPGIESVVLFIDHKPN
jgi:hypothetical protein